MPWCRCAPAQSRRDAGTRRPARRDRGKGTRFDAGLPDRPEATAETFRGGWLHTGDLGRRDAAGYLYFVGRIKDVIRRGGENIAAAEVETVLRSHPGVLEAAAVPVLDELLGEEVKVHILLGNGHSPQSVPPAELISFSAQLLARYKVPRFVEYRVQDFDHPVDAGQEGKPGPLGCARPGLGPGGGTRLVAVWQGGWVSHVIDFRVRLPLELRPAEAPAARLPRAVRQGAGSVREPPSDTSRPARGHGGQRTTHAVVHAEYEYGDDARRSQ